ncbi:hypothetical protein [Xanthomonas campestris]|uniref:hypothetical protein n=1 Tax=Xanthomonas campestris TaxID=339 RepID=UPI001E40FED2|nr:hypothetical protein [Xanthomonas campestris]MCC5070827.1 hypothetical protein [Xanthomonas campestris pv. plantaginis]
MKLSPLQLDTPQYPVVSIRAVPGVSEEMLDAPLPVSVRAQVLYDSDLSHMASLSIEQNDETQPYVVSIQVLTSFRIDIERCREAYKALPNPEMVAVNIARILYASAREILAMVSARAPYGSAMLPGMTIEASDVDIKFETGKVDFILEHAFGLDPHRIQALRQQALAKKSESEVAEEAPKKKVKKLAVKQ